MLKSYSLVSNCTYIAKELLGDIVRLAVEASGVTVQFRSGLGAHGGIVDRGLVVDVVDENLVAGPRTVVFPVDVTVTF